MTSAKKNGRCLVALILALSTMSANAALVKTSFEFTTIGVDSLLGIGSAPATFSGYFTYESDTPDAFPGDPSLGVYDGAYQNIFYTVGSHTIQGTFGAEPFDFSIGNDTPSDSWINIDTNMTLTITGGPLAGTALSGGTFSQNFVDNTGLILTSDELLSPFPTIGWTDTLFQLAGQTSDGRSFNFIAPDDEITSINSTTVPLPNVLSLLALGVLGLIFSTRRR